MEAAMIDDLLSARPTSNPKTQAAHRRQVWLQVYLPFGVGVVVVIALVVGLWLGGAGAAGVWADVSLVFLMALALVIGLLGLAAAVALLVASIWVAHELPPQAARLQHLLHRVQQGTRRGADASVAPLLTAKATWGAVAEVVRGLAAIWTK
jgi:hypothetical protein